MSSIEQIRKRVEELSLRHKAATEKKSRMQGQLDEKKKELANLKKEIEGAGYDPKNLKHEKAELEAQLKSLMETFHSELSVVEESLEEYEN